MAYFFLALTIAAELIGAIASRYSDGFRRLIPSVLTIAVIIASYFFFSVSLRYGLNIGIGYAIWSGVGVCVMAVFGYLFFQERLNRIQVLGIVLVISGIAALELGAGM
jgi:small multidrug resistance pump